MRAPGRSTLSLARSAPLIPTLVLRPDDPATLPAKRHVVTESVESALKFANRTLDHWDPHKFVEEENLRVEGREKQRRYLVGQLSNQFAEIKGKYDATVAFGDRDVLGFFDTIDKKAEEKEATEKRAFELKKNHWMAGVEGQRTFNDWMKSEKRAQDGRDFDALKLRLKQQNEAHEAAVRKRRSLQQQQDDANRELETEKAQIPKAERDKDREYARESFRDTCAKDDLRILANTNRIKAVKETLDRPLPRDAWKLDEARRRHEEQRQACDELRDNLKMDNLYRTREVARQRQMERCRAHLKMMTFGDEKRNIIASQMNAITREAVDKDFLAYTQEEQRNIDLQRDKELKAQRHLVEEIALRAGARQDPYRRTSQQEKKEGSWRFTDNNSRKTDSGQRLGEGQPDSCAKAVKGRAEVKPWIDVRRPIGLDRVGTFAGEGGKVALLLNATDKFRLDV